MKKFINPSISPNLERNDMLQALKIMLSPHALQFGGFINRVEAWFKYNFGIKYAYTFSSARESEFALLKALHIGPGDEILVQAFTCVAVINPILWCGAKPVYVDINEKNYSMNGQDLKKKISSHSKGIIIQHTFGIPGSIDEVGKIAKENNLFLIEDCAHVIGGVYKNKKLGLWSDAAFFSFGRDKAISSVFGGIVITNKKRIADRIKKIKDLSPYPSHFWIYKQLFHPVCTYFVLSAFNVHPLSGKLLLKLLKSIHLISQPILPEEKESYMKNFKTKKYPNALAILCFLQLLRISRFNKTRTELVNEYRRELRPYAKKLSLPLIDAFYLRIPARIQNREKFMQYCKTKSLYLGDWYSHVVDPKDVNLNVVHYKIGSCRTAEKISGEIINIPSYPTMTRDQVLRASRIISDYFKKNDER